MYFALAGFPQVSAHFNHALSLPQQATMQQKGLAWQPNGMQPLAQQDQQQQGMALTGSARQSSAVAVEEKVSVEKLNRLMPHLAYVVTEKEKVFTARLTVERQEFTGEGRSKREAKDRVAGKVLLAFPNSASQRKDNRPHLREIYFRFPTTKFNYTEEGPQHSRTFTAQGTHSRS